MAELRAQGAPAHVIAQFEAAAAEDRRFPVWVENWPAVEAFLAIGTQWRAIVLPVVMAGGAAAGAGGVYWQGLDYAGASAGLVNAGIVVTPVLWADLRTMEAAARDALNGVADSD